MAAELSRRLGLTASVAIGMGSMIGAGIFVVFGPATAAAGDGLFIALALASLVAACNAFSSARLAALYPESGGTYVYGRERLGPFWGYLAGWAFIVGKIASCAAMALVVGTYAWPEHAHLVAAATVVAVTALNYAGVQRSVAVTVAIVAVTLAVLAAVVIACLSAPRAAGPLQTTSAHGIVQGAALLFFAFAGYARLATLGEEVRDPERTIPRAIAISLLATVAIYGLVAYAALRALGAAALADTIAPLSDAVRATGTTGLQPVVRIGAAIASLGALLALLLGVSRTTLALARDGHLPRTLSAVHPRFRVPHHAEVTVGAVVTVLVLVTDLRGAIGFSSFAVLAYYLIANASAWTLPASHYGRIGPAIGMAGCVILAFALPLSSILIGLAVLLFGAAWWLRPGHDARPQP